MPIAASGGPVLPERADADRRAVEARRRLQLGRSATAIGRLGAIVVVVAARGADERERHPHGRQADPVGRSHGGPAPGNPPCSTTARLSGRTSARSSSHAVLADRPPWRQGQLVRPVLDRPPERRAGLGERAVAVDEAAARRGRSTAAAHASSLQRRLACSAARGTSPDAACSTSASIPSSPASTRQATWPSPRNSRSSVIACHERERRARPATPAPRGRRTAGGRPADRPRPRRGPAPRPAPPPARRAASPTVRRRAAPAAASRAATIRSGVRRRPRGGDGVVHHARGRS